MRIKSISETDFDAIIEDAGGTRISSDDSADYLLNEAVIELKLLHEEGFEKLTRQSKLAKLFRESNATSPVIVIDQNSLDSTASRTYSKIVGGPIKNHVKKAARQLEATAKRYSPGRVRVLVLLNIGYTALSPDEFKAVCIKCTHNDTAQIDWLVCGGIYYYSDTFDHYVISPFEGLPINVRCLFPSFEALQRSWGTFVEASLTDLIKGGCEAAEAESKMPVVDLAFDVDGVRYVKPAPSIPRSTFWPGGQRPRDNTTGIESCPPIALVFPALSLENWKRFKEKFPVMEQLRQAYREWLAFSRTAEEDSNELLKPFVAVNVEFDEFMAQFAKSPKPVKFRNLCQFATNCFESKARDIMLHVKEQAVTKVLPSEYIRLEVREIGQDKANDVASIYHVSIVPGFEREEIVVENLRVFYEYGVALAAAYAVKRNLEMVVYTKERL